MKKVSLLMAALCAGVLFGAEYPDFTKAETWQAVWTKSVTNFNDGVLTIDRPQNVVKDGSGAWYSVAFPVTVGETISGTVDVHYIEKSDSGKVRVGIDALDASGKRVAFLPAFVTRKLNGGFETQKFAAKIPEGAVKAKLCLCIDNFGKVEFKNVVIK